MCNPGVTVQRTVVQSYLRMKLPKDDVHIRVINVPNLLTQLMSTAVTVMQTGQKAKH